MTGNSWRETWGKIDWFKDKPEDVQKKVKELIANGADVNAKDEDRKNTPLIMAAYSKNIEAVKDLIEAGADPTIKDAFGYTPLLRSLSTIDGLDKSRIAMNEYLIKPGVDLEAQSRTGFVHGTALVYATVWGHMQTVQSLIKAGADVNIKNREDDKSLGMFLAELGRTNSLKALIAGGADIEARDKKGNTMLMYAIKGDHLSTVEALILSGANVMAKNAEGKRPLQLAEESKNVEIITMIKVATENIEKQTRLRMEKALKLKQRT